MFLTSSGRLLGAFVTSMVLGPTLAGCGGTGEDGRAGGKLATVATANRAAGQLARTDLPARTYVKGDQNPLDDDDTSARLATGVSRLDPDADDDDDTHNELADRPYFDSDDRFVRMFGHLAGTTESGPVRSAAERYYADALTDNGPAACLAVIVSLSRRVAAIYAGESGPAYLRGSRTCPDVLARLFAHNRAQLVGGYRVVQVRVSGDQALALLGSKVQPARYLALSRQAGEWHVSTMLPQTPD